MQNVRRKSIHPQARTYLEKAKTEGIDLSWNLFEYMLPQDGFTQLGLTCQDCLQGPCRLNPFRSEEKFTVCGLSRDELVYRSLSQRVSKGGKQIPCGGEWDAKERLERIEKIALEGLKSRREKQDVDKSLLSVRRGKRLIGLGTLKPKAVNVCLQTSDAKVRLWARELGDELWDAAVQNGAPEGFNLCLVGDLSPEFDTVTNTAHFEFALLTGLVDLVIMGEFPTQGRQFLKHYPTVWMDEAESKEALKEYFLKAVNAYSQRPKNKIQPSDAFEEAYVQAGLGDLKSDEKSPRNRMGEALEAGEGIAGICLLGGGSCLRVTADEATVQAAKGLLGKKIQVLTYGNTAATLGQYGFLTEESGFIALADQGLSVMDWVETLPEQYRDKTFAIFPEMNTSEDLQMAFAFAAHGIKVLSGVRLPVEGSSELAQVIHQTIEYCKPGELASRLQALLKIKTEDAIEYEGEEGRPSIAY